MAKVKVVNNNLDYNLNRENFNNVASEIVFTLGSFSITSNFDGRTLIDYSNQLSSFVRPVTLETIGITDTQSEIVYQYTTNAVLNLDQSDLNTFVRYGSAYEFLRVTIQNVIVEYPGSLFANSQTRRTGNVTFTHYDYNEVTNICTFRVPTGSTVNTFGLVFDDGNTSHPDDNVLKNLNLSYDKYVVWTSANPENNSSIIIGFTGSSLNVGASNHEYLTIMAIGNPFSSITGNSAPLDFHIKPNNVVFEEFRAHLKPYEKYVVSARDGVAGFKFSMKDPTLLEDGSIVYSDTSFIWSTSDEYNIDVDGANYKRFLNGILTIGSKYDTIKTDLISRFLTPLSLKTYDLTDDGKMDKLLRLYGAEFDQLRTFIDSLVNINRVTYDKINNIPDQLIKNLANTFGWDYFSLINEGELVENFLSIDAQERNLNDDLLPAEIDIELWRRILINTNYFWKSKGTREAIKAMFLLIGIPEPFINITEYVYTVEGRIDPNTVPVTLDELPSASLPYDTSGYPVAPVETNDFFFQISGDTDSGQAYMDNFRAVGFNLMQTPDNKKSWVETGSTTRIHYTTPQYYQEDSKLVLNTKEVIVALDTARGIEYDVYDYIQKDFAANSSGFTQPFSFVNISLGYTGTQDTFAIPPTYNNQGDFEVRYNGILLNAPKTGSTTGITDQADYTINYSANTFTLTNSNYAYNNANRRDVIQVTLVDSGGTSSISDITTQYVVTRVKASMVGTEIPLPTMPRGDVQVTINGIALTKGTSQFSADYIVDPNNTTGSSKIIISNPDVISYLAVNPDIQVVYVDVVGTNLINARSEITRIDSFNTGKVYFNAGANKFVYTLNYKASSHKDLKILIDGIALEPGTDYTINALNPFEVFLPKGLKFGTIISVYYLIAESDYFNPIVNDIFGVGDISELSFLEFLELIQRKLINVRNRKTISDFKGGWYPTLLNIYTEYLKRAELPDGDPLQSNGYTFANLYPFLSKYNAFFQRFVDQLLSATIIQKGGGLLVRNTVFTKQKFMYRRGVNIPDLDTPPLDARGNIFGEYLGDDGSVFQIFQETLPPPPPPTILYVETTPGILGSLTTGGQNIIGYDELIEYGIEYKIISYAYGDEEPIGLENLLEGVDFEIESMTNNWTKISQSGPLSVNHFSMVLTGLDDDATYNYRAFIESLSTGATGNTLQVHTPVPPPPTPSLSTTLGNAGAGSIDDTGGYDIIGYADIDYYAVQYRRWNGINWEVWQYSPTPPLPSGPLAVNHYTEDISGLEYNRLYQYRAYMTIDGTPYYGNIREITTLPEPTYLPTVTTTAISSITDTSANSGGNVVDDGNATVTARGVVWSNVPSPPPTIVLSTKTVDGSGTGVFTSNITPLLGNTTYFARAYATNSVGTAYGTLLSFTTDPTPPTTFLVSMSINWTGDFEPDSGFYGVVRLMQGGTLIDHQTIGTGPGNPEKMVLVALTGTIGQTYTLDFSALNASLGGIAAVANRRWRIPPSFTWTYSPIINPVTSTTNYNSYWEISVGAF